MPRDDSQPTQEPPAAFSGVTHWVGVDLCTKAPTTQQLVLAAVHVALHGPYCSALQRAHLLHKFNEPMSHRAVVVAAEEVLAATVREVFAALRPQDLDRISQAVEQALEKSVPRFRAPGDGSRSTPV
jgi:hypothetical protein